MWIRVPLTLGLAHWIVVCRINIGYRFWTKSLGTGQHWGWHSRFCLESVAIVCDFNESGCLGLQLKLGGKFHLKLNIGGKPIVYKYREGKMQRTLKRELKSTWNCWKGSEGNQCRLRHTSLSACGGGAVSWPLPALVAFTRRLRLW